MDHSSEKRFYSNIPKMFLYFVVCAGLAALGVVFIVLAFQPATPQKDSGFYASMLFLIPLGLVSMAFFGMGMILFAKRLLDAILRKPVLIMSQQGIVDRTSMFSQGRLMAWDEFEDVRSTDIHTQTGRSTTKTKLVSLKVKDPDAFALHLRPLNQSMMKLNRKVFNGDYFAIAVEFVNASPQEVVQTIVDYSQGKVSEASVSRQTIHAKPLSSGFNTTITDETPSGEPQNTNTKGDHNG